MNQENENKRYLPRLLCNDNFSDCLISIMGKSYKATPINFHHCGIALYTISPIPKSDAAKLTISFQSSDGRILISDLPIRIAHANEMDIGCQYGISFQADKIQDIDSYIDVEEKLITIEAALATQNQSADRYGLFS